MPPLPSLKICCTEQDHLPKTLGLSFKKEEVILALGPLPKEESSLALKQLSK